MKILTIDLGIEYTGIALVIKDIITVDTLTIGKNYLGIKKATVMSSKILQIVNRNRPDYIAFEDYGFGGKFFNVKVSELMGIVKYKLSQIYDYKRKKIQFVFLAPSSIKKQVTGNGRATKSDVKKVVKKYLNCKQKYSSHEIDAVAVFLTLKKYLCNDMDAKDFRAIQGRISYEL